MADAISHRELLRSSAAPRIRLIAGLPTRHRREGSRAIPEFTADRLDEELKLHERGAADGRKNVPAADARELSSVEAMVVSRVEGAIVQRSNEMLGVGSGQDFTTLPQDLEALAGEPQTVLTQFRAKKARAQSAVSLELNNAQTDFARAYRDYRAFRIQHQLTETEPSYDDVFWRKVFWLALLFIVEVAANGWMIGQASPGGLVQGWSTALMISVLVVLTGSLLGAGPWRYLNYRGGGGDGLAHRLWAGPALVVGGSLLLLFAFYIAHYRYALSQTALDAPAPDNILTSVLTQPFQPFQQLESLLLFVIALLIGIFATVRGAYWDDPYPGYGPRHRRMEAERERVQDLALGLSSDIDEAKEAADQALAEIASSSTTQVNALRRAIARTQDNAADWDFTAANLLAEGRDAIEIYRDANREARSDRPPAHFNTDAFAKTQTPSSTIVLEGLTKAFSRATANITACKSQLAGARAQLEAEYHSFYDDEMTPFLKNIENAATVNVRGEFADVEKLEPPVPPTPRRRRAVAAEDPAEPLELEDEDEEHEEEEAPRGRGSFWSAGALSFKRKGRR
jgi:hypothetical protein